MKANRFGLIMLVVVLIFAVLPASAVICWYPGYIHAHSRFSDGNRSPKSLKNVAISKGGKFLVVTDHDEQIPQTKPGDVFGRYSGYENYVASFIDGPRGLVVIPGTEITVDRGESHSHILAFGESSSFLGFTPAPTQQEVLNQLFGLGVMSVAAHPNWNNLYGNYLFDTENCEGLSGIEFFNDGDGYQKTLEWYLREVALGRNIFVTSGCDSHAASDYSDYYRWNRKTYISSSERTLSRQALISALYNGRTYAADSGAYFKTLNLLPQFSSVIVGRPVFNFTFAFSKKTTKSQTVRIYRDGKLVPDSVQEYLKGRKSYAYYWQDPFAKVGWHSYVIEVEKCLVTSQINLGITEEPCEPVTLSSEFGDVTSPILSETSNFTLEYEVDVSSREGSVYFRLDSEQGLVNDLPTDGMNGYGVVFCPFANQGANPGIMLVKRVDGVEQVLTYNDLGCPRASGYARLKIVVDEDSIRVYENDVLVLEAFDSSFLAGRLVWRVYGEPGEPAEATFRLIDLSY